MTDRHGDGIVAFCKPGNKVSLGFVEGLNNKIRGTATHAGASAPALKRSCNDEVSAHNCNNLPDAAVLPRKVNQIGAFPSRGEHPTTDRRYNPFVGKISKTSRCC
jgi:hypothetical protein